ncbi:hypothetical protein [Listeria ivanovii]|uniref:hypothetical protein n=1 Tax=Listeria ivanovii TaxID=1638 RepID=UPI0016287D3B|nr:hypothetical protein [Listeria ivanovii]MBC2254387.1 hypothetical protein [Listeria ivanovii]MBM5609147.1 hypothetical protein [Listeria ivanovii]MBM5637642.1 hypothetical protein [Listeria ivanovii]MBM5707017.1 hypothetical protein [Listeria ivanovii]
MYKKKSEWLKTSKVIEKVAIAGLACLVIFSIPIPTQATEQMATYIPFNGKQYEYSSKKISKQPTWQHTAYNKSSSTTQKVKYKVSREKYVKGSVSTSAEFSLMKTGVKVSAEVGVGKSVKESTTVSFAIPPKKNAKLAYGSQKVSTSGYIVQYSRGNIQSKKAINGNWTYSSYSSMTEF